MKKIFFTIMLALLVVVFLPGAGMANPDLYVGDTSMFGGSPIVLSPNVLIIVDNSGSMGDTIPGGSYDPSTSPSYTVTNHCDNGLGTTNKPCTTNAVYTNADVLFNADVNNITTSCNGANPRNLLLTTGQYNGRRLNSDGTCRNSGTATYLLGNYINWSYGPGLPKSKISIARDVVTNLLNSTTGINFGLMTFHYPSNNYGSASGAEGSQFLSASVAGSTYISTIKDMDAIYTGTTTNRKALISTVATLTDLGYTPLGESLDEALRYFQGAASDFANTIGVTAGKYTSPVNYGCQKNYIIFVTDGMATADDSSKLDYINSTYGRYDGGGCTNPPYTTCASDRSHSLPGVAKYLYEQDLSSTFTGSQNVTTYTIGFGLGGADQEAIDMLQLTADDHHGRGKYFLAGSETGLSAALTGIMSEIFAVNTSYVAPVVPVNPDNRTSSGNRIYMGFFKPLSAQPWLGNLKKYGLDLTTSSVLDKNNVVATNPDGSFKTTASSYWSNGADGAEVDAGGVGEKLFLRNFTTNPRNIYTYKTGNPTTLSNLVNAFTSTNITAAMLGYTSGVVATDNANRDKLINFVRGIDAYDDNSNSITTENREWMLGDILHSKPAIVLYNTYTAAQEGTAANKTMIYVGANDGMLHAFRDYDGQEQWAFVPPDLLSRLRFLRGSDHAYFVDASPIVYKYDKNGDGVIDPAQGDMVLIMFGERRGGGFSPDLTDPNAAAGAFGYYYLLDVTDPVNPKYLWSISGITTGDYPLLSETWSEPKMAKIKSESGITMVAAIIGAGYDNINEDNRYGNTQLFKGGGFVDLLDIGNGTGAAGTSTGALPPTLLGTAKGRGIYVVEIARLDTAGAPSIGANSGRKVWGFSTAAAGSYYSIPSEVAALDTDGNGFADRLYVGDTGGGVWRFDIGSAPWTGRQIFNLNNASDKGRKLFYKPSVFSDVTGTAKLLLGTGDREHPLNKNVVDRMYGLKDVGQTSIATEAAMYDATADTLQLGSTTATDIINILAAIDASKGWYIKLDQSVGEKVLASPLLFNDVGYFTTYAPSTGVSTNPCILGNLGNGALYAVSSKTGEAVLNFNAANDSAYAALYAANQRATGIGSMVLQRADRSVGLPPGIPSPPVLIIGDQSGNTTAGGGGQVFVTSGGNIQSYKTTSGGTFFPIYWRSW